MNQRKPVQIQTKEQNVSIVVYHTPPCIIRKKQGREELLDDVSPLFVRVLYELVFVCLDTSGKGRVTEREIKAIAKPKREVSNSYVRSLISKLKLWLKENHLGVPIDNETSAGYYWNSGDIPKWYTAWVSRLSPPVQYGNTVPRQELDEIIGMIKKPRVNGHQRTIALVGMGGVGKTNLACSISWHSDIISCFADGIFWVWLHEKPGVFKQILDLLKSFDIDTSRIADINDAVITAKENLRDKNILIVLDDLWTEEDLTPFFYLSENCTLLITSRNRLLVNGCEIVLPIEKLPLSVAEALMREASGMHDLPSVVYEIIEECDYLPLSLVMIGPLLQRKTERDCQDLLETLRNAIFENIKNKTTPAHKGNTISAVFDVSYDALDPELQKAYQDFCVFPKKHPIPEEILYIYWEPLGRTEKATRNLLGSLIDRSLIFRWSEDELSLHDLQLEYLYDKGKSNIQACHQTFLEAYDQKYPGKSFPPITHKYFYRFISYHLWHAGKNEYLESLLLHAPFLELKAKAVGIDCLIDDYGYISETKEIQYVKGILQLLSHIVRDHPDMLLPQLAVRLEAMGHTSLALLRQQICSGKPSITPYGNPFHFPDQHILRKYVGHLGIAYKIELHPETKHFFSCGSDGHIRKWDIQTGICATDFEPNCIVKRIAVSDEYLLFPEDYGVHLWDLSTDTVYDLMNIEGNKRAVAIDERCWGYFAIGNVIVVFDLHTRKKTMNAILFSDQEIICILPIPKTKTALASSQGDTVILFDVVTGEKLKEYRGHTNGVTDLSLHPNQKLFASASMDKTIRIWEITTSHVVHTLSATRGSTAVSFSPSGEQIVASYFDDLILWDTQTGEKLQSYGYPALDVLFVNNESILVSRGSSGIHLLDLKKEKHSWSRPIFLCHQDIVKELLIMPNGACALSACKHIWIHDLSNTQISCKIHDFDFSIDAMAISSDGKYLATASHDLKARIINLLTNETVFEAPTEHGEFTNIILMANNSHLIVSIDHYLHVFTLKGRPLKSIHGPFESVITHMCQSSSERHIILSHGCGLISLVDYVSGVSQLKFGHSESAIICSCYVPDEEVLIIGNADGEIQYWKLGDICPVFTHKIDNAPVLHFSLSSDRKYLVSAHSNHLLCLWITAQSTPAFMLLVDSPVHRVAFIPGTYNLITGNSDGNIDFFCVEP